MIIKKVNIISFGGISNKEIEFSNGLNIIYGENEAGKSTIQSFIKIWLYGFSNYRGKDYKQNERMKFKPITGENISGELLVKFQEKEFIIKRTFGKSKKEDTSIIIDAITGEEAKGIPKEEPGRYFLNVNRATFINTLFIGQLGVGVKKGKEEEILEKLSNSIGAEEGEVSYDIAVSKLEKNKKNLMNSRKTGVIDKFNIKYGELSNERYEGYQLAEHNLDNEQRLISINKEKEALINEINNLEIYKKYLKKIRLQKEYEDIAQYFRKKEELENQEKSIKEVITFNNEVITLRRINEIKEEYLSYLNILDSSIEEKEMLEEKESKLTELKYPLKEYKYIDDFPEDILNILERLKIRKEVVGEKIIINNSIEKEINFYRNKENEAQKLIGVAYKVGKYREEIGKIIDSYDEKLRQLKELIDNDKNNRINVIFICLSFVITFVTLILGISSTNIVLSIISYIICSISIVVIIYSLYSYKSKGNKLKIVRVEKKIEEIETQLDFYCKELKIVDYKNLINNVKLYDDYLNVKEKIEEKISEKIEQSRILEIEKAIEENIEINEEINKYVAISKCDGLDSLISDVYKYKKESKSFMEIEIQVNNLKAMQEKTMEQLSRLERAIKGKLESVGFINIEMKSIEDILNELENKVRAREDIIKSLAYVEETYAVLTKDKDMDEIKDELRDVININFEYSYKNEDEIDVIVKEKNINLVEIEKEIKDIENEIKNRFNGKRTLPIIEEEYKETEVKLKKLEVQLKATDIARNVLSEAYDEIRSDFGPVLNSNVIKSYENFTDGRYKDVLVSDDYEMKVINKNNMMNADILSNGANDQLFLSLRLAFINMIFNKKSVPIYLDDAFVQYDDKRLEKTINYLVAEKFIQCIIFTCQNREENILRKFSIPHKYIKL